jgi:hypothetical protein
MKTNSENNPKKHRGKKGKTLKEKVQRHLNDKDDVITEQDLKEVIVGVDAVDLENPDEPAFSAEDIPPKKGITPWDIVDDKE